ncbi:hypothetical protein ACOSQ4_020961 [Xanthoceras sorbifolium]
MSSKFSIPNPNEAKRQPIERKAKGKKKAAQLEQSYVLADEAITPPLGSLCVKDKNALESSAKKRKLETSTEKDDGTSGLRRVALSAANGGIYKRGAVVPPCRPPTAFDTRTATCGILPSSVPLLPIFACSLTT